MFLKRLLSKKEDEVADLSEETTFKPDESTSVEKTSKDALEETVEDEQDVGSSEKHPEGGVTRGFVLKIGGWSERGARDKNDDYFKILPDEEFLAISDGVGGAPYGDVVSRVGCTVAAESYGTTRDLMRSFSDANRAAMQVLRWIDCAESGSAATLLLACFREEELSRKRLVLANAGDTVAFLLHDGVIKRLTEVDRSGRSNFITAAIGLQEDTAPTMTEVDVVAGDRVLLCTDGVWQYVKEKKLAELLGVGENASMIASSIAREATGSGTDNATAVVVLAV